MAVNRRADPNFVQVSGYVPKEIALKFKAQCMMLETSQSEALEQAIQFWLEKNSGR